MAFFRAKAGQKAGFRVMLKHFEIKKAFRYYIKQIDSMLPCVCSVTDHRRRQNVLRTSVTPGYPNSCLDSLISIFLVTDPFYYKYGTLLFISTIVKNLKPSTHHLPRLALLFAGGMIFEYLM